MNWLRASLWLLMGGMLCLSSKAQAPADSFLHAHAHYNFVLEAFNEIGDAADAYLAFSDHSADSSAISDRQTALSQKIQEVRKKVEARPGYKGDDRVRDGLLTL